MINGFFLVLPFLAIRFPLLSALNKRALHRAVHFAPMEGGEKIAYAVYQLSNLGLFLYLFFLTVQVRPSLVFGAGLFCYPLGLGLCALAVISFAFPDDTGFNATGLYRFSRNPMYMAYFICFVGMALLTQSPLLLDIVLIFQFSAHWIVLAEERWCLEKFGDAYTRYKNQVRRYL